MKTPIFVSAYAAVAVLLTAPAMASCFEPITPFCADTGTIGNSFVTAPDCRNRIEEHLEKLGRYQSCLEAQIAESKAKANAYRTLLAGPESD
jgi:hypothetical protein